MIASDQHTLISTDPATGHVVHECPVAGASHVDAAVRAARAALPEWSAAPLDTRIDVLQRFAAQLEQHETDLADTISRETGKPRWDALGEVGAMIGKIPITIDIHQQRQSESSFDMNHVTAVTRFRPHGVLAVLGPFNFPGHVPNGHIVPALLAGNTIVFKPSEHAPLVGQLMIDLWHAAGLPDGVLNLVQGRRETGELLAAHPDHDGILFTGSADTGIALRRLLADQPNKILALELGGNNPLVVADVSDLDAAAALTVQSAYITTGQRCTCARRLIVPAGRTGDAFIDRLIKWTHGITTGAFTDDPEPFMGPLIHRATAEQVLHARQTLIDQGATPIITMHRLDRSPAFLTPGLIDVTALSHRQDTETFGPMLQLIRVNDFDHAIREANQTRYGLVAALLSDSPDQYQQFLRHARAGLVNWNRPTTGASSKLPFGGVGHSGNHRPSGASAIDYCAYPVASLELDHLTADDAPLIGVHP